MELITLKRAALAIVLAAALTACQHHHRHRDEGPQAVRNGSLLTLTQALSLPAGDAFVYFQDQRLLAPEALRHDYPYCRFGLTAAASASREVPPNAFVIASVDYDERSVGALGEAVSSTQMNLQTEFGDDGYRLTCMLPVAAGARFITVSEIEGAIGKYFLLNAAN